jgi:hypothetical protein
VDVLRYTGTRRPLFERMSPCVRWANLRVVHTQFTVPSRSW